MSDASEARRRASQGWGGHASPVKGSGEMEGLEMHRRKSSTVDEVIRPLPQTPPPRNSRAQAETRAGVSFGTPPADPLRAHASALTMRQQDVFDPRYSLSSRPLDLGDASTSLTRVNSHPFSLASGTSNRDTTYSSDSDEEVQTARRSTAFDDREELEARSPLQPSSSAATTSHTPFHLPGRTTYLSPTPSQRLSPNAAATGNGTTPSPPSSPSRVRRSSSNIYPKGSPLGRRRTLGAAAQGIRRMSVRVVNMTGGAPDLLASASSEDQPSPGKHKRLSDQDDGEAGEDDDGDDGKEEEEERIREEYEREFRKLRGKTLGVFGPENPLRRVCASVLTWRCVRVRSIPLHFVLTCIDVPQSHRAHHFGPHLALRCRPRDPIVSLRRRPPAPDQRLLPYLGGLYSFRYLHRVHGGDRLSHYRHRPLSQPSTPSLAHRQRHLDPESAALGPSTDTRASSLSAAAIAPPRAARRRLPLPAMEAWLLARHFTSLLSRRHHVPTSSFNSAQGLLLDHFPRPASRPQWWSARRWPRTWSRCSK